MKKIYTIFMLLIFKTGFAQPVLNSSEMLPFGATMHLKYIDNLSVIDTTLNGPNQTWDFSTLTGSDSLNVRIVDPANTPYGSSFPTANYAYAESPVTAYRYFNLSSTKMERVGSYYTSINTYSDPQVEYVFPLALGISNQDTWASTNSSFGGTYDITCVGTGDLILPGGTYSAIMVRVDVSEFTSFQTYFWYDADNGAILLERVFGDGLFVGDAGLYLVSLENGINENMFSYLKYNNPVRDNLQFHYALLKEKDLQYIVTNVSGQILQRGKINSSSNYQEIDFSMLSNGFYFVEISSGTIRGNRIKIVKESYR